MTKNEKIRWTVSDVVIGLLMVYMCICLMFLEGEVYGDPITPTVHIIFVIIGGAMAVGVTWFVGRNLYRLWTNRSLLTGEPIDNDSNNE